MTDASYTIGILGAGQLSLYLCQSIRDAGHSSCVLSEHDKQPATHTADEVVVENNWDQQTIADIIEKCDIITFERDEVADELLEELQQAQASGKVEVYPSPGVMALIKDKGKQKQWLVDNDLPTLPFELLDGTDESLQAALKKMGQLPLVQKMRCGGYDGKGVQILRDAADAWPSPSLFEPLVSDMRELAVVVARDQQGNSVAYEPVDLEFDERHNALSTAHCPSRIDASKVQTAREIAEAAISKLDSVGIFAVEFFLTGDGELLINEISPRVHNSGHLTMESNKTSQFDQHVRCITGQDAEAPTDTLKATMLNILYQDNLAGACPGKPTDISKPDTSVTIHWYGKGTGSFGRKMGHINATGEDSDAAVWAALDDIIKTVKDNKGRAA